MGANKRFGNNVFDDIKLYADSEGTLFPKHWEEHLIGGFHERECVFCFKQHYDAFFICPPIDYFLSGVSLPIPVCKECKGALDVNMKGSWAAAQEDLAINTTPKKWNKIIVDKIMPYIKEGVFPPSRMPDLLGKAGVLSEAAYECDFCSNKVADVAHLHPSNTRNSENFTYYLRPVTSVASNIEYPGVCCNRCDSAITDLTNRVNESEKYLGLDLSIVTCGSCKVAYPVTHSEQSIRSSINDIMPVQDYLCNLCVQDHWGKRRNLVITCQECSTQYMLDLYHKSSKQPFNNIYCPKCKKHNMDTIILDLDGYTFSISYVPIVCPHHQTNRLHFTVKNDKIQGDRIIHELSTSKTVCTSNPSNCRCGAPESDKREEKIKELTLQLWLYKIEKYGE